MYRASIVIKNLSLASILYMIQYASLFIKQMFKQLTHYKTVITNTSRVITYHTIIYYIDIRLNKLYL